MTLTSTVSLSTETGDTATARVVQTYYNVRRIIHKNPTLSSSPRLDSCRRHLPHQPDCVIDSLACDESRVVA